MPVFVSDTFTDTRLTALSAHTGETGATWTKAVGYTGGGDLIHSDANRVRQPDSGSATAVQYASGVPDAADYYVESPIYVASVTGGFPGVIGRCSTSAGTFYFAIYISGQWQLWKSIATAWTQLGTGYSQTLTAGSTYTLRLDMSGTTIRLLVDGVERVSVTNSDITAAGRAGLISSGAAAATDTTSWHFASIEAATATVDSALGGGITLDASAAGGTLSVSASDIGGGITLDASAAGGSLGMQSGIVSAPALRNWSGSLQTSVTIPVVTVCRLSDGAQVLTLANQVTHASTGDLSITNAALLVGTWYMVMGWNVDGSARFAVPLQATA